MNMCWHALSLSTVEVGFVSHYNEVCLQVSEQSILFFFSFSFLQQSPADMSKLLDTAYTVRVGLLMPEPARLPYIF